MLMFSRVWVTLVNLMLSGVQITLIFQIQILASLPHKTQPHKQMSKTLHSIHSKPVWRHEDSWNETGNQMIKRCKYHQSKWKKRWVCEVGRNLNRGKAWRFKFVRKCWNLEMMKMMILILVRSLSLRRTYRRKKSLNQLIALSKKTAPNQDWYQAQVNLTYKRFYKEGCKMKHQSTSWDLKS